MNYQKITPESVKFMNYNNLCDLLYKKITPLQRTLVLARLTEINNHLIGKTGIIKDDIARSGTLHSRRNDVTEVIHPSMNSDNRNFVNPIPVNFAPNTLAKPHTFPPPNKYTPTRITDSLDDIIDGLDFSESDDDLESRLNDIFLLQKKIVRDKRSHQQSLTKK
jgi:hypothetical protein